VDWVITTGTPTGRAMAQKLVRPGRDLLLYLPWDLLPVVRRALRQVRPRLFLCFETELWPALFYELGRLGVPIAVVNGRISPTTYPKYLWIRPLMERFLKPVSLFLAQSEQDARRFAAIGAAKDRIAITGNLKWDFPPGFGADGLKPEQVRELLNVRGTEVLWTAGSTHPGEEAVILQAYAALKTQFPQLRLLIAPRHPERVGAVERQIRARGMAAVRRSQLGPAGSVGRAAGMQAGGEPPVVVLDTLGELIHFYRASDLVFVGGSLVPRGGHNLAEPAILQRPILSGPYLFNFSAVAEPLAQAGALAVVRSAQQLERVLGQLLRDPQKARAMGQRAYRVVQSHQGATRRTADWIALRWGERLRHA
jgi:3-deoxy-D-manno-octulosonic-acid transferase